MTVEFVSHLSGLLAIVGHLLNGHHLVGIGVSGLWETKNIFIFYCLVLLKLGM